MKIAYLTSMYPDISHTFILREVRALRERGIEVATFSVRRPGSGNVLGVDAAEEAVSTRWLVPPQIAQLALALLWSLSARPIRVATTLFGIAFGRRMTIGRRIKWFCYFLEAVLLAHWLDSEAFDHLHCHFGNNGASTGMLAARLAGVPFSMTCHGSELREIGKHHLVDKVARAAFVVCVSQYGKAQLMEACPPEQWRKLHVVRCGILPATRAAKAANDGPHRILSVGRLSAEKGQLVLLKALAELRDLGVDFRCTVVGDGPMRSSIIARAEELRLTASVTFTGALEPIAVAKQYQSAEVVVLTSFNEGVPVVLMEAMAHGLPVVATRVGGIPELVDHGKTGLVVAPGDANRLAHALKHVLEDRSFAQTLGAAGRRRVLDDFNIEASAARLSELFKGACSQTPRPAPEGAAEDGLCPPPLSTQDS